eukprot:1207200-Prymnesium_polylepis.1
MSARAGSTPRTAPGSASRARGEAPPARTQSCAHSARTAGSGLRCGISTASHRPQNSSVGACVAAPAARVVGATVESNTLGVRPSVGTPHAPSAPSSSFALAAR